MNGLSSAEVAKLQARYGKNEIREHSDLWFLRIAKKFIGPIPLMIEAALVLSVIARRWEDFVVISVLLAVNVTVDILQEEKARNALLALKQKLTPTARVVRDGTLAEIDARELVPGDVIKLTIGESVPADASLLSGTLHVNQSAVTGESLPVLKEAGDELFVSSVVDVGSAYATVTATGHNSSLGKNAALVARAAREKESHFQKAMFGIGRFLIVLSIALIIVVLLVLIVRGDPFLESIQFALVLAIASIPVALPAVLSVTMAIGAAALAKRHTIVSHFQSVEELAGIDELCIDKTGTLTRNELTVTTPIIYGDVDEETLMSYALLASDDARPSAIEQAIYAYAKVRDTLSARASYSVDIFTPFDPVRKLSEATAHRESGESFSVLMGAPQAVAAFAEIRELSDTFSADVARLAEDGIRTVAVARKDEGRVVLVGLIPFSDPLRDDAKATVEHIQADGVQIRMLTGDNVAVAAHTVRALGLEGKTIRADEVYNLRKPGTSVNVDEDTVFAEVIPEDKYRIVEALQRHGHIVAMMGDGVNDAPALKKADVGIAVADATPAARAAADIILLDRGLSVIRDAISLARMTFERMQSYALFRISETVRVVVFITLAILAFNSVPISAIMIVLLALLNDIPVMAIAYDNAPVQNVPVRWRLPETIFIASLLGIAGVVSSFIFLYWLHIHDFALAVIQTLIFLKLDVAGHSTLYLTRTGRMHFWERPFPSLRFFIPAFGSRIAGTLIAVFGIFMHAISWEAVAYVWLYASVWFLINDQIKVLGYRVFDRIKQKSEKKERLQRA